MDMERVLTVTGREEYGVELPDLLRRHLSDCVRANSCQESILGFIAPPVNPCAELAADLADAMGKRVLRVEIKSLLMESALTQRPDGGGRQADGLVILAKRLLQEIQDGGTADLFVLLEGCDVFRQVAAVSVGQLLRELLGTLAGTRPASQSGAGPGRGMDLDRVFLAVIVNDETEVSEGLGKCTEFFRIRMMTSEEKSLFVERSLRKEAGVCAKIAPEVVACLERGLGVGMQGDTCRAVARHALRLLRSRHGHAWLSDAHSPWELRLEDLPPEALNRRSRDLLCERSPGEVWTVGLSGGKGVIQRYQTRVVPGSGQRVLCCRPSEAITRAMKIAHAVARERGAALGDQDLYFDICDDAYDVQGGSCGLAVGLSVLATMLKKNLRRLCVTGTLELSGAVGAVGRLTDKVVTAYNGGVQGMLIPECQRACMDGLPSYVTGKMQITPVRDLWQAVEAATDG